MEQKQYFGGTGITLEKLKVVMPTINVDGTTYPIERWLDECAVFDALVPGKSLVWIPYGCWMQSTVTEVVQQRFNFKNYGFATEEMQDWWIAEPYCKVENPDGGGDYYVYEISFYKKWKRKTQMSQLIKQRQKPKRKFLSKSDIADIKRQEVITNSQSKQPK
jgi:hypothetical protein